MRRRLFLALGMTVATGSAMAETAGPPAPATPKATPAQTVMANYKRDFGAVPLPQPCERPKDNEVVVCGIGGRGGSAERLPLPDERGAPNHERTALNEAPAGDSSRIETGSCGTQDQTRHCVGGLNPIVVALRALQLGYALVDPEGGSDLADKIDPPPH